MKLYFEMGNEVVVVEIRGRKIYFSNISMGFRKFIPLEPYIEKIYGESKLKEYENFIKQNVSEQDMKDYVVREFATQGFKLKREVI